MDIENLKPGYIVVFKNGESAKIEDIRTINFGQCWSVEFSNFRYSPIDYCKDGTQASVGFYEDNILGTDEKIFRRVHLPLPDYLAGFTIVSYEGEQEPLIGPDR